ncbi:hypothetical protein STRCI_006158 [Streptomyces cinnabarinus]|uniref:Uncharacterized protein n=1 Tax=Streptomyces cinnabarinus TaxID=67287 RepID=A0ABY7KL11_9ACTN|nr:hypothetical protein [Streptomyces cinnabarinus]WAZ24713.1 hypothetical protein STRCI_006158 [Streptomyces cinnabarinus]
MKRGDFHRHASGWTAWVPLPTTAWTRLRPGRAPLRCPLLTDADLARAAWTATHLPELFAALRHAVCAHHEGFPEGLDVRAVHIHPVSRDGIPYVGVEFRDLGVALHGTRVVDLGGPEVATDRGIAEQDATDPRAGLDEALIGHWSGIPFDYGVMESSEFELRANGQGWSNLANALGECVTRLTWRCPEPGLLELRTEGGAVSHHAYRVTGDPVPTVAFDEPVEFCHQFARSG